MSTSLFASFENAGIPLDPARSPLRDVHPGIFQLDVARDPVERVRLWPGDRGNVLDVLSIDPALGQLVLRVQEPPRPFEERIRIRGGRVTREQVEEFVREGGGGRVLRPRGSSWLVERITDPAERRFLVGFDQRHLFAAQFREGDTVCEAHESLKPAEVRTAERRGRGPIVRQGEWFFVPVTPDEEAGIKRHLALHPVHRRGGRLPGPGEPHWSEEIAQIEGSPDPETGERRFRSFVRGAVRHRDHSTVCFDRWRAVHINAAVRRRGERARGFYWMD